MFDKQITMFDRLSRRALFVRLLLMKMFFKFFDTIAKWILVKQCLVTWPNGQTLIAKTMSKVWQTMFDRLLKGLKNLHYGLNYDVTSIWYINIICFKNLKVSFYYFNLLLWMLKVYSLLFGWKLKIRLKIDNF